MDCYCIWRKYLSITWKRNVSAWTTDRRKREKYTPSEERSEIIAEEEEEGINNDLFRDSLKYQNSSHIYKNLNSTKSAERNQIQADIIKSALTDLKSKIKNMSENEKRIEQPEQMNK